MFTPRRPMETKTCTWRSRLMAICKTWKSTAIWSLISLLRFPWYPHMVSYIPIFPLFLENVSFEIRFYFHSISIKKAAFHPQSMWLSSPPGHIYLSSPFLFEHCISYRPEEPTLALMCRFGFMDEEDSLWVNHLRGRDMLEANCGNRGWGENGAICFFFGCPKSLWTLFFSHRIGGAIDFTEINSSPGKISPAFLAP